ncbi:hypothetical protein G5V58_14785 [Nocardioides anomalus]|uniref:Thioredoxin domain-containing protein n=1 Tax=Nocardioides anomalus TaxID=2712223 RepID=A0A6G6WFD5_9ACTN|nr:hypothetical protein [Nocardioides anomalus]QIG43867.1 hypothetical protein G5V58_14785 [Nocardioides anomalus]
MRWCATTPVPRWCTTRRPRPVRPRRPGRATSCRARTPTNSWRPPWPRPSPSLPTPDDVYPSDGQTAGPLPDADFAAAQDWQAAYTVGAEQVLVMVSSPAEPFACPQCVEQQVPGGTLHEQVYTSGGLTWRGVWLVRPDGFVTAVLDGAPRKGWTLDEAAVRTLLQDPRLVF